MILQSDIFTSCSGLCLIFIIFAILFLFIKLIQVITTSYLVGILILLLLIIWLLKNVGQFAMYPGSFGFIKSDIQIRGSSQIINRVQGIIKQFYQFANGFQNSAILSITGGRLPSCPPIIEHCLQMIATYELFQNKLSPQKQELLQLYRSLLSKIQQKEGQHISLYQIIREDDYKNFNKQEHEALCRKCGEIIQILNKIIVIMHSFLGPLLQQDPNSYQLFKYKVYAEKLYQIRFAFRSWDKLYEYTRHTVNTNDGYQLQCAVIHNFKDSEDIQTQQAVLICNPNGAYLQYFAIESSYIKFYLKNHYKIILWNYRGYGSSTGSPSISCSIQDAKSVYDFVTTQLDLHPVIVHGYSIGGGPAINLAYEESSKIKLLIADRTFNSISDMSLNFGKVLHFLTKLIFSNDCRNMGQVYTKVKCNKIMIWDTKDEVIDNNSSLKKGVMLEYLQKHHEHENSNNIVDKDDSDQQNSFSKSTSTNISSKAKNHKINEQTIEKFTEAVHKLVLCHTNQGNLDHDSMMQEQLVEGEGQISTKNIKNKVIQHLYHVDGGGQTFFSEDVFEHISKGKIKEFKSIAHFYLTGLAFYGTYFPLQAERHHKIKSKTMGKLKKSLSKLKKLSNISEREEQVEKQKVKHLLVMIQVLENIGEMMEANSNEDMLNHPQLGILLPTNGGHNADLTKFEMNILLQVIKASCE